MIYDLNFAFIHCLMIHILCWVQSAEIAPVWSVLPNSRLFDGCQQRQLHRKHFSRIFSITIVLNTILNARLCTQNCSKYESNCIGIICMSSFCKVAVVKFRLASGGYLAKHLSKYCCRIT